MLSRRKMFGWAAGLSAMLGAGAAKAGKLTQAAMTFNEFRPRISIYLDKVTDNLIVVGGEPGGTELAFAVTRHALRTGSALTDLAETYAVLKDHLWHTMHCKDAGCPICRSYSDPHYAGGLPVGTRTHFHMEAAPKGWTLVEKCSDGTILCAYDPNSIAALAQT